MGIKHQLKEPHPYFKRRKHTTTGEVQSQPGQVDNTFSFVRTDTVPPVSYKVYTVIHRGYREQWLRRK